VPEQTRQRLEEKAEQLAGTLAERLAYHRQARGLTRKRLQELTGISERMLIFIEKRERNLSVHSLSLICQAMGIEMSDMIKEAENATPNDSAAN